jgi:K+-sensing histidine kinase KdpD
VLTSFGSGLTAAYFLLPPKFSFYVDDPVHVAELGFTIMLAAIASKVVAALADGDRTIKRELREA